VESFDVCLKCYPSFIEQQQQEQQERGIQQAQHISTSTSTDMHPRRNHIFLQESLSKLSYRRLVLESGRNSVCDLYTAALQQFAHRPFLGYRVDSGNESDRRYMWASYEQVSD
jgi:hypothetical protein